MIPCKIMIENFIDAKKRLAGDKISISKNYDKLNFHAKIDLGVSRWWPIQLGKPSLRISETTRLILLAGCAECLADNSGRLETQTWSILQVVSHQADTYTWRYSLWYYHPSSRNVLPASSEASIARSTRLFRFYTCKRVLTERILKLHVVSINAA